jgi:hypothetical protein
MKSLTLRALAVLACVSGCSASPESQTSTSHILVMTCQPVNLAGAGGIGETASMPVNVDPNWVTNLPTSPAICVKDGVCMLTTQVEECTGVIVNTCPDDASIEPSRLCVDTATCYDCTFLRPLH